MGERRTGCDFYSILGIQRSATVERMGERRPGDFYNILDIISWYTNDIQRSATVLQINSGYVSAMQQAGNGMIVLNNSKLLIMIFIRLGKTM